MKTTAITLVICLACVGCQHEPMTLREEAQQAQENLETVRENAAELIAESEEDAVDMVANARQDAKDEVQDATRKANRMIADANEKLAEKLDELARAEVVDAQPNSEEELAPLPQIPQ